MLELDGKRIIVTFLMHLGDLTLTTPFFHVLRKAAPNAYITYLVDEKLQDVIIGNPNINEVMTIDKKGKDKGIKALMRCANKISAGKYDILINLHPNERCSFIDFWANVPQKVGFSHFLFRPFLDKVTPLNRKIHAADMYIDVLRQLGIKDLSNNGLEIYLTETAQKQAKKFWQEQGVEKDDMLVGFNIGSAVVEKRWPSERFAWVADILIKRGYKVVFFGGSMDSEIVQETVELMKEKPIVATGQFSIGVLAAAMKRCQLIITNDSGPMHVAISQKVPVVALYGPSNPMLYGPYTNKAIIVKAEPLVGEESQSMKDAIKDKDYMQRLSAEKVLEAVEKLI